jgi:hypothetical protein
MADDPTSPSWFDRLRVFLFRGTCVTLAVFCGLGVGAIVLTVMVEISTSGEVVLPTLVGAAGIGLVALMIAVGIKGFRVRSIVQLQEESRLPSALKAHLESWLNGTPKTPPRESLERGRDG